MEGLGLGPRRVQMRGRGVPDVGWEAGRIRQGWMGMETREGRRHDHAVKERIREGHVGRETLISHEPPHHPSPHRSGSRFGPDASCGEFEGPAENCHGQVICCAFGALICC